MEERDILLMAALIAAVRTARFEDREFAGATSPRMQAQISNSLALARRLCERAEYSHQQFLEAEQAHRQRCDKRAAGGD